MREKKTITEEIPTVDTAQESAVKSEKPAVQEEKPKPKRPRGRPPKAKAQPDEKTEIQEPVKEQVLQPVQTMWLWLLWEQELAAALLLMAGLWQVLTVQAVKWDMPA